MQGSWLGIVLMATVVVVGLAVSKALTKDEAQRKATTRAFLSLVLLLVLFFLLIIVLKLNGLLPVLATACIVVPLVIYATVLQLPSRRTVKGSAAKAFTEHSSKSASFGASGSSVVASGYGKAPLSKAKTSIQNQTVCGTEVQAPAQKASIRAQQQAEVPVQAQKCAQANADVQNTQQQTPKPVGADPQLSTPVASGLLQQGKPQIVKAPAVESKKTPAAYTVAPPVETSDSLVAPESPVLKDALSFEACFRKAETFREKGMFTIAARLYRECSSIASEASDARKAFFAEMVVYVKNNDIAQAKKLALSLRGDLEALSPLEVIKLDAVLRIS